MYFKKLFLTMLISGMMATFAIAGECPGKTSFGGSSCSLDDVGSNGDGRVYCSYNCTDGSQVVKVFAPVQSAY